MNKFTFFLMAGVVFALPMFASAAACPAAENACQAALTAACDCGTVTNAAVAKYCWAAGNKIFSTKVACEAEMAAVPAAGVQEEIIPSGLAPCTMKHVVVKGCTAATPYGAGMGLTTNCLKDVASCQNEVCCLMDKVLTIGDWIFIILIVVAAIFILWGAFEFVTSAGSAEKVTGARNKLIWALVGVIVAFISASVVKVIVQIIAK